MKLQFYFDSVSFVSVVKAEGKKSDNKASGPQSSSKQGAKNGTVEKKENSNKTTFVKQDDKVNAKSIIRNDGAKEAALGKKKTTNSNTQGNAEQAKAQVLATSKKSTDPEEVSKYTAAADQKEYFMLQDEYGKEVDISKVKLPPGITITKINSAGQKISSNGKNCYNHNMLNFFRQNL